MSDRRASIAGRGWRAFVVTAVLAVIVSSMAFANVGAFAGVSSPTGAQPTGTAALVGGASQHGSSLLSQPVGLNAGERAAVSAAVTSAARSGDLAVASLARSTGPSYLDLTPDQILERAGAGAAIPLLSASLDDSSGLTFDSNFASWSQYLEVAGAGCLTAGGSAALGAGFGITTTTVVASTETVATKTNPAVFALSCAVGAAVGLVIFQNGLDEGQAAVNYAGLWTGFAQSEWGAYSNYLNLTAGMYASLASGVQFAQVAFDRMADNAALLQLGNASFNAASDLITSGLASELAGMATDYQVQLGQDFENVPMWLDALTANGAGFAGYGFITPTTGSGTYQLEPSTNVVPNASGSLSNATAAGLIESASGRFLWASSPPVLAYLTCAAASINPCSFRVSSATATGKPETWFNATAGTYAHPQAFGLGAGLYNLTVGASETGYLVLPFAAQIPILASLTIGSFGWEDRYQVLSGASVVTGHSGGACSYSTNPAGSAVLTSAGLVGYWDGERVGTNNVSFSLTADGNCQATGATTQVTPNAAPWFPACQGGAACYSPFNQLSSTLGNVEYNATTNAATYWTFIRSLGYSSLASIPPDCVIPAPYQAFPSDANLGTLTLNETGALYLGWLHAMGLFYGSSGSFSVCSSGKLIVGWNWLNSTFSFIPGTSEFGGAYLNNGTAAINTSGAALATETFGNRATWALPVAPSSSVTPASVVAAVSTGGTAAGTGGTTASTAVTKGETLVASFFSFDGSALPTVSTLVDSAGNSFAKLAATTTASVGDQEVWVVNRTTVASATDTFTVGTSGAAGSGGGWTLTVTVVAGKGVGAVAPIQGLTSYGTDLGLLSFSWTNPASSVSLLTLDAYGSSAPNETAPSAMPNLNSQTEAPTGAHMTQYVDTGALAAGAQTQKVGFGAGYAGGFVVTVKPLGATAAVNESLILIPTLKSVTVPIGANWPVPASNPIWAFYATRNSSQNVTEGAWSILNLVVLTGNGTTNGTGSAFGAGSKAGDTLYLSGCEVNYTFKATTCGIALTNWTTYVVSVVCANNSGCGAVNPTTGGGGGGSSCGAGVALIGGFVGSIASAFGFGGIGCLLAYAVVVILVVVLVVAVAWIIAAAWPRRT